MSIKVIETRTVLSTIAQIEADDSKPANLAEYESRIEKLRATLREAKLLIEKLEAEKRLSADGRQKAVERVIMHLSATPDKNDSFTQAVSVYNAEWFGAQVHDPMLSRDIARALINYFAPRLTNNLWQSYC